MNQPLLRSAQQRNSLLSGAYKLILYAVVFASSVAILVKFVGSFNIYVTTSSNQRLGVRSVVL